MFLEWKITQRLVWTTHVTSGPPLHPLTGLILPKQHIDHGFSFSSLCSLFICPPRALTHPLFTEIPSCLKASWCSALLNQQHIKVKSAGKKKKGFPLRYNYLIMCCSRLWNEISFILGFKKEDTEIPRLWWSISVCSDLIQITFAWTVTEAAEFCGGQRGFEVIS